MTGLVGWWPLHEKSGKARDLSGNGNHGTLNGDVTQGVAGKGGLTSYNLNGNDAYVTTSSQILPEDSREPFSISAWIKTEANTGTIVRQQAGSGDYAGTVFQLDSGTDTLECYITDGTNSIKTNAGTINTQKWHHVCITYEGSKSANGINIYVNGNLKSPDSTTDENINDNIGSGVDTTIGARPEDNTAYFNGTINDVRIYNRALSPQEIQTLYEWGSGDYTTRSLHDGRDSGAVSRWKFESGSVTRDSWGSNTLTDNTSAGTTTDAIRGDAKSFDGDDDHMEIPYSSLKKSQPFTICGWYKGDNDASTIFGKDYQSEQRIVALSPNSGDMRFIVGQLNNNFLRPRHPMPKDEWIHAAGIYRPSGPTAEVYLNGVLVDSKTGTVDEFDTTEGMDIGRFSGGKYAYAPADMDDLRIYNRALEPYEVFQLYQWGTQGRDMRKLTVNARGDQ